MGNFQIWSDFGIWFAVIYQVILFCVHLQTSLCLTPENSHADINFLLSSPVTLQKNRSSTWSHVWIQTRRNVLSWLAAFKQFLQHSVLKHFQSLLSLEGHNTRNFLILWEVTEIITVLGSQEQTFPELTHLPFQGKLFLLQYIHYITLHCTTLHYRHLWGKGS